MRVVLAVLGTVAALTAGGCGGSSPTSPTASATMSGSWVGSTSDSSGSMMGAGLSSSMAANATWAITQTANNISGTMQFAGYQGGMARLSGTVNRHTGTFTMTMPIGSMMMATCSATASGTFDMDDSMMQLHGTYNGSNTCSGPFTDGQLSFTRR